MNENQFKKYPQEMFERSKKERIYAEKIEGKPIGYFKDAAIRFRKNKASLTAFIILTIVILFTVFAPIFSPHKYDTMNPGREYLLPKVPILEKIGIANGLKQGTFRKWEIKDLKKETEKSSDGKVYLKFGKSDEYIGYTKEDLENLDYDKGFIMYLGGDVQKYVGLDHKSILKIISETEIESECTKKCTIVNQLEIKYDQYQFRGVPSDVYHYFGTDDVGRDLYVRVWMGARLSLIIGFIAAIFNLTIGVIYGSISGYFGGNTDVLMQRFIEIIGGVPWFVVFMLFVMRFGQSPFAIAFAFVITGWTGISRVVRMQFFRYRNREYVLAARSLGVKNRKLIYRHILPNGIGTIITSTVLIIPGAIFGESALSYLGLGVQGAPSVGMLLKEGSKVLLTQPHVLLYPSILISVLMLSFNLIGNGLRDAFNPSLRGTE